MLGQGPGGEQEASAAVDGAEKAGWSHKYEGLGKRSAKPQLAGHIRGGN